MDKPSVTLRTSVSNSLYKNAPLQFSEGSALFASKRHMEPHPEFRKCTTDIC